MNVRDPECLEDGSHISRKPHLRMEVGRGQPVLANDSMYHSLRLHKSSTLAKRSLRRKEQLIYTTTNVSCDDVKKILCVGMKVVHANSSPLWSSGTAARHAEVPLPGRGNYSRRCSLVPTCG